MTAPRIWLLAGPRPGELAQQRRLAQALGEAWEEKPVFEPGSAARPSFGWRPQAAPSCGLSAPWPELVISFGKTLQAALWIKHASGGRVRIVHLGRPRGIAPGQLDLIVPMPQDAVPDAPNVLRLHLPLNLPPRLADEVLTAARQRLEKLPRPWTALIVGGVTRHYHLDTAALVALVNELEPRLTKTGGSLLVSTSPRTPAGWIAPLRAALISSSALYELSEYGAAADRNAYPEYLALADEFVLTGDTASMIADCWRSGRPVSVLPLRPSLRLRLRRLVRGLLPASLVVALVRRGAWASAVDLDRWIDTLAQQGIVGIFGESVPRVSWSAQADDDLQRVVSRVQALLPP
ncbi:MAG: Fission protein [Hydrocarboniphaga sp.]|uniref:ELM1/GtrOC1 family putative glycosyltransferase n=1 Tax=Hydrocarboniphaga sp. TaxID=2033016 RepID=UPI00262A0885|nr:ELM1/GtrOC1 family putative glycosyltransferase [Hydrocarboniphaga sp.]MDB5968152.1 Fission protein [Hydrocarboniphaga sp.]